MGRNDSLFENKVEKVRKLLLKEKSDGICFTQQKNISWLTSGRGYVNIATQTSVAFILITTAETVLISKNIETKRLIEEEFHTNFDEIIEYKWYEPFDLEKTLQNYASNGLILIDLAIEDKLKEMRVNLTSTEIECVKLIGKQAAEAIEYTASEIDIGDTEHQISAKLSDNCKSLGLEPIVNLVAVDNRVHSRRHPLPTNQKLSKYAMLVIGARSKGIVVSATRLVHFGMVPKDIREKHYNVATIDANMINSTRKGVSFKELFINMRELYSENGFPMEWEYHHQGGLTGYDTREKILLENETHVVTSNQLYAWNPSIAGVKSEDTILTTDQGIQIVTQTDNYPLIDIKIDNKIIKRPDILIR